MIQQKPPTVDPAKTRDILRVLCRIPIQRGQLVLYHLALAAGEKGFLSSTVKQSLGFNQDQHRGLMSALAGRINNTPRESDPHDKVGQSLLFKQKWDGVENIYYARPELLAAIALIPELEKHVRSDVETVKSGGFRSYRLPDGIDPLPQTRPLVTKKQSFTPFEQLLTSLDEQGLYFPAELVTNFVLALQTKRFVILTGISGTGKTRLAQALAERYPIVRKVMTPVAAEAGMVSMLVQPYMHKHHRFVPPAALTAQLPELASLEGSGSLTVHWPGGKTKLSTYKKNNIQVFLKGEFRIWFEKSFPVGARVLAHVHQESGELHLSPSVEEVEREEVIQNYAVIAVRPDWTDARGLLGYYNPIRGRYMTTAFLRLLLRAKADVEAAGDSRSPAPFFVVLDEMNLARVEHYFSDFLSAMESGEPIVLHDEEEVENGEVEGADDEFAIPRTLSIPPNVYFIGTVNVDESTYMFSPKVLDRAFTLELNDVQLDSFGGAAERSDELNLAHWDGLLDVGLTRKPHTKDWLAFSQRLDGLLREHLIALHHILADRNRHFGYRVANEIARFVELAAEQSSDPESAVWAALDLAILQKVLVKLHGTQHELSLILRQLLSFALAGMRKNEPAAQQAYWKISGRKIIPQDVNVDAAPTFPRSAHKLWRMLRRLDESGFTSWIE